MLSHARNDVRLRDRLSETERQRKVLIGTTRQCFLDEDVARNLVHYIEHGFIDDALLAQTLDHAHASALRGHANAGEARTHASHSLSACSCANRVRSTC